jgi:hypothetical protein
MNFDKDAFTHGPIDSKLWLCDTVKRMKFNPVDNVIVLGSWSGTMPFLMYATSCVPVNKYILVDTDEEYQAQAKAICNAIECNGMLEIRIQDANTITYPDARNLVVCTSTDNIVGNEWFNRIPKDTAVVLQGRTGGHRDCVQPYATQDDFNRAYPLTQEGFLGQREFVYPDHSYTRFMKIGIK